MKISTATHTPWPYNSQLLKNSGKTISQREISREAGFSRPLRQERVSSHQGPVFAGRARFLPSYPSSLHTRPGREATGSSARPETPVIQARIQRAAPHRSSSSRSNNARTFLRRQPCNTNLSSSQFRRNGIFRVSWSSFLFPPLGFRKENF